MNILIIARGTPSKRDPQWGSFEFDQAKALASLGHNVIIASVDTRFRFYWRKIGLTTKHINGIHIYNLFVCPGAIVGLLGGYVTDVFNAWVWHKMAKVIAANEEKPDVIYSHYLFNTHKAVRYLKDLNAPVVAIEHWSEINKPVVAPSIQKMGEDTYPKVDKLLTVSKAAQKAIKEHFDIESTVVYNMVGEKFIYLPHKNNDDKVRFIATGSLILRKGFDLLIEAFATLQLPKDKWELHIIGAGKQHCELQKQIEKHHLTPNIRLVGQQTSEQIIRRLNHSDVFVLPSRMETFGVVYIEALACGLPVIATPCGGPEEFVNEKNGLLVPVDDVKALAAAIRHMYEHHQNYDRQAIADECQARFSPEVIAKQLTRIFEEVIKNKQ